MPIHELVARTCCSEWPKHFKVISLIDNEQKLVRFNCVATNFSPKEDTVDQQTVSSTYSYY
jgi:hypothetical protein